MSSASTRTGDPHGIGFGSRSRNDVADASRARPATEGSFIRPQEETKTA
jgi:hypothetical protein